MSLKSEGWHTVEKIFPCGAKCVTEVSIDDLSVTGIRFIEIPTSCGAQFSIQSNINQEPRLELHHCTNEDCPVNSQTVSLAPNTNG